MSRPNAHLSVGKKYGLLTVMHILPMEVGKHPKAWCKCDCGNEKTVLIPSLRTGATISCGCFHKKIFGDITRTHGRSKTPEYRVWAHIKWRCSSTSFRAKNYNGRGISMCERWKKFENFIEDMGTRPFPEAQLDRINNNLGYYKENCRWTTRTVNARNKRITLMVDYLGETMPLVSAAELAQINIRTIKGRIFYKKATCQEAFDYFLSKKNFV